MRRATELLSAIDAAGRLEMSPDALGALTWLDDHGFVEIEPGDGDRVLVRLTEAGRAANRGRVPLLSGARPHA